MAVPRSQSSVVSPPPTDAPRSGGLLRGLFRALRPRQWVKNVLVFAAPLAAGMLLEPGVVAAVLVAFVAFSLVASGTYLLNDALDVHADRLHPRKRHRPIASGAVPVGLAKVLAAVLLVCGATFGLLADWRLTVVLVVYVLLMQGYSLWLKRLPVIELAIVSSGFVMRAIAGGTATGIAVSTWFLIVVSFASLFIVVGKRHAEKVTLGDAAAEHRPALSEYPVGFLQYVGAIAAAVAIIAYCLWTLIVRDQAGQVWFELSIVPFVLALLRYALLAERGEAGAPEEVFLGDRTIQVLGALWAAAYAAGVYAA